MIKNEPKKASFLNLPQR